MKTKWIVLITFLMLACSSDSDSIKKSVVSKVSTGTWTVTYYLDSDTDETTNYTGYNFTFGASNVLTATNGTNTYTGTWSVTTSNSSDDSFDDLDFNIAFATPALFEELSDDWDIVEVTSTKIELVDVSGGGGGTDYLTFTRN
jgi:hypothetical protein